jgi:hypothetical protein
MSLELDCPVRAHQRIVAEVMRERFPVEQRKSLEGYSVETISRETAVPVVLKYEWLGNVGKSSVFVGLFSPSRELHGVACFGHGPAGNIRGRIGSPAFCLERGACVHYAPPNAASFLINSACKLVFRISGVPIFFAYADPSAGEYGAVYQAANWTYLGQGLDGKRVRSHRYMVLQPGKDGDSPANWKTTRELRRNGRRLSFDEARLAGWQIAAMGAKHVYATNVGAMRRAWRKTFGSLPYPSPNPELKRKP